MNWSGRDFDFCLGQAWKMMERNLEKHLVTPEWLAAHKGDPQVRLIEIAGTGQEAMQAYNAGHVPGAVCWDWKAMLWDSHMRDFPSPEEFSRRLGSAGIGNDTTVVFYGEGMQFGVYAWWTFTYCGHADVRILDGARDRWQSPDHRDSGTSIRGRLPAGRA